MKHNLQETHQDLLGQYNTTNADIILGNFKHLVEGRDIVDPFVGAWHLIKWSEENGSKLSRGYDIDLLDPRTQYNDYFQNPIKVNPGELVLTNPPYLSSNRNKTGDRTPYGKFNQNDYYKCYLATLDETGTDEAIIIMPTNFFCESNKKARDVFFSKFTVVYGEYWTESVFDGVDISVCVIHVKRASKKVHEFVLQERPSGVEVNMELSSYGDWRHGKEFFQYIENVPKIEVKKTDVGDPAPNTNIVVSLLDKGKLGLGLSYNDLEPIYCNPKSFTTYQVTLPMNISENVQKQVVEAFNDRMSYFRDKYRSMFLSNYIDAKQKILSRSFVNKMISRILQDLGHL